MMQRESVKLKESVKDADPEPKSLPRVHLLYFQLTIKS